MAEMSALQDFVREAMAKGESREVIRAVLIQGGWPEHQVSQAMNGYEATIFGIPMPSARTVHRPNAWFFQDSGRFAGEVFQIVEWLVVVVAIRYAAIRAESIILELLSGVLWLLLTVYLVTSWMRLEWWLWPNLDRTRLNKSRTFIHMLLTLGALYLLNWLVVDVSDLLLKSQTR